MKNKAGFMVTTFSKLKLFFISAFIIALSVTISAYKISYSKNGVTKWSVQRASTLRILGSSNVNTFGCDIRNYDQPDTLICFSDRPVQTTVPLKGTLEIDVSKFDCHNKMLTNDLRKTLKVKDHPILKIKFLSLERFPKLCENKDNLKGNVEIELAGVCKKFDIDYSFAKTNPGLIEMVGSRIFSFADFSMVPPSKFGGLIKVKERFDVNFKLLLTPLE